MDFLEELLKGRGKTRDIQAFIDSKMKTVETIPPMTPECRVRPSGIEKFCPRYEALRVEKNLVIRHENSARLERIFAVGRAYEKHLRDTVLAPIGILVGAWRCPRCTMHYGSTDPDRAVPRPTSCPACNAEDEMAYVEPFGYADEPSNLGGSGDGFILWGGEVSLLEVKTANKDRFDLVAKNRFPFPEHHSQAQVYMSAFGLKKTLFWYHNKNSGDQLCLWVVASESSLAAQVAKARSLKHYFHTKTIPERICVSMTCARAKECPIAKVCFEKGKEET